MWSDWKIVSADQCQLNDFSGKVKRVRFCDNPTPQFGGELCEDPEKNEDEIECSDVKNSSKNFVFLLKIDLIRLNE